MTKTFTRNDVIRYLYDDIEDDEKQDLQNLIICDPELLQYYYSIKEVKERLDKLFEKPSEFVTQKILDYSKSLQLA